jgi:molybdopterin biosynthesis enzyme MoaB
VQTWRADLILTTGGTGLSPRDVYVDALHDTSIVPVCNEIKSPCLCSTPEAITPLLERHCPAFVTQITTQSLKVTPMAMLSRAVAGVRGSTLIITFPGSSYDHVLGFEIIVFITSVLQAWMC